MTVWIIVDDGAGENFEGDMEDFFDVVGIYSTENNALNALNKIVNERNADDEDFEGNFRKDLESYEYQGTCSVGVIGVKAIELDTELNVAELGFKN